MKKWSGFQMLYLIIFVVTVFILGTGTTYAYWTATTSSTNQALKTESTTFSISMDLTPVYNDFSFIPMNNEDAIKALKKGCKDKYNRGACAAYKIKVYDYDEKLNYVSGYMDIITNNMSNLSYMVYRESDVYVEDTCVILEEKNYCVVRDAEHMGTGLNLSLGEEYNVYGIDSTEFVLLIWLTNLESNQNSIDIGSFTATIVMQAGNGGKIQGVISSAVNVEDNKEQDENIESDIGGNTEEKTEE